MSALELPTPTSRFELTLAPSSSLPRANTNSRISKSVMYILGYMLEKVTMNGYCNANPVFNVWV